MVISIRECFVLELIFQQFTFVLGILGGYEVGIEDVPYQVNYGDICGGALIHHMWALTAAHCGTEENFIRVGSRHRLRGLRIKVLFHKVHPEYGIVHTYDYDIQLLRLYRRLNFNARIQAIRMDERLDGNIKVSGWGYPKEKTDYNPVLHQVQLKLVPMKRCQAVEKRWYNHTLTGRMFCAGGLKKDACQGDSGGAAVSLGQMLGLSSFGFGCGRNIPGVYINTSNADIRQWIIGYTGV